ncbi:UNVERIFIED_CONTAM: hypothetical protein Slati_1714000 [Sesamum latifolium]|uniref:Reverse transcriptase domain-containing protein n=1 Tax=Sesamum latifolium TaxID=2727402 RepID=A0AAW2WYJ3_9LAMI
MAISHQGPRVSHLLFADDTLILCQASKEDLGCVRRVLEILEAVSGLSVNLEKSSMTFSKNTPIEGRKELAAVLKVRIVEKHDKYLGLRASVGHLKRMIFQYIKDRVWAKLQSWSLRNSSQAGRMVLLQSIISSMPTYAMSCFLLPLSTCRESGYLALALRKA